MHRSSNVYLLTFTLLICLVPGLAFAQNQGQSATQTGSSSEPAAANQSQQQPVGDLTPPSDAEIEKQAEKAGAATESTPAPNQPGPSVSVPPPPEVKKNKNDSYTFRQDVEEVILYATVVDPHGHMLTNLDRSAFTVYEDGAPQKVTSFHNEDIPVSIGLVIDNSGSMRNSRPAVNQAALNFVRSSNPQDEVFIVNFNDDAYNDQDFTSNVSLMKEALEKVEARGTTALYDAVVASADHLAKGGKRDKKALLVVTDGEDRSSRDTLEQAVGFVQSENGPTIYSIGLLDNEGRSKKRAKRALDRLSVETGGLAYFPEGIEQVDEITREVAHDIRNQYTIGYKPSRPQAQGGFRNVRVEARGPHGEKLQVRTRSGYFAGQKQQPPTKRAATGTPTDSTEKPQ